MSSQGADLAVEAIHTAYGLSRVLFGVALENVLATIERPPSHHGTDRPGAKNSPGFFPARLLKNSAGAKQMAAHADRQRLLEWRDPLPRSTLQLLDRLRREYRLDHARTA